MADSTSRPWSSVPSKKREFPPSIHAGGPWESNRLNCLRSNGSCGAIHGASTAASTMTRTTIAATTITLERRKEWTTSLSSITARRLRAVRPDLAGIGTTLSCPHCGADARINSRAEQIDNEVDGGKDEGDQKQIS